jgi:hypothetical protein
MAFSSPPISSGLAADALDLPSVAISAMMPTGTLFHDALWTVSTAGLSGDPSRTSLWERMRSAFTNALTRKVLMPMMIGRPLNVRHPVQCQLLSGRVRVRHFHSRQRGVQPPDYDLTDGRRHCGRR